MKPITPNYHPHPVHHLPDHEHAARRRRVKPSLPAPTEAARPTHPPTPRAPLGRRTADTRFNHTH